MKNRILVGVLATGVASSALADEAKWTSEAELGLVITGGNSETQTANGKLSAVRETEKWKEAGRVEALNASSTNSETDEEQTTAEKYSANLKADYKLTESNFLFGLVDYSDDRFSGFDFQATAALGYGRVILNNEKHVWEAEIGPGVRYFKLSQDRLTGTRTESDSESVIHAATKYQYNFNAQSSFTQELIVDGGEDVTISQSITALKAQIVNKLAMKASFKVKKTSEVPVDVDDTDTETALTLVYSF